MEPSSQHNNTNKSRWTLFVMFLLLSSSSSCCYAFEMRMMGEYKPPVKSSVKKLYDRRFGITDSSTSTSTSSSSSIRGRTTTRTGPQTYSRSSSRTAKSAYAGTMHMPEQQQSFEQRMRNLVMAPTRRRPAVSTAPATTANQEQQQQQHAGASPKRILPPNVNIIESLQDYKIAVGDEREKIVVARFYATYCRACQAVAPHFYRMANQYPGVKFVDVPVTDKNAALHQGLGIPTLPYIHCYHPDTGIVEEQRFTRKDVAEFKNKLQSYVTGSCPLTPEDTTL